MQEWLGHSNIATTRTYDGFVLTEMSANTFDSVTIDPRITFAGVTTADITFGATSNYVNLQGLNPIRGQFLLVDVNAVPEPATWILTLAGLAGIAGATARRRGR